MFYDADLSRMLRCNCRRRPHVVAIVDADVLVLVVVVVVVVRLCSAAVCWTDGVRSNAVADGA